VLGFQNSGIAFNFPKKSKKLYFFDKKVPLYPKIGLFNDGGKL